MLVCKGLSILCRMTIKGSKSGVAIRLKRVMDGVGLNCKCRTILLSIIALCYLVISGKTINTNIIFNSCKSS